MAKRISDLDTSANIDSTYVFEVDAPDGATGELETRKYTLAELKTLFNVPTNTKVSVTVSSLSGATISSTTAELATSGDLSIYNIEFNYSSGGEVDPEFQLNQSTVGRTYSIVPVTCVSYIGGVYNNETAYMSGSTPDKFKVKGNFQTATFRVTIAIVR